MEVEVNRRESQFNEWAAMPDPVMFDDSYATTELSVADVAVELFRQFPHREPLQILDEAMRGRQGQELDFEFDQDEVRPPHPFAMLLRRAFAPTMDPLRLSPERRWRLIILPFAQRYRIWEPDRTG